MISQNFYQGFPSNDEYLYLNLWACDTQKKEFLYAITWIIILNSDKRNLYLLLIAWYRIIWRNYKNSYINEYLVINEWTIKISRIVLFEGLDKKTKCLYFKNIGPLNSKRYKYDEYLLWICVCNMKMWSCTIINKAKYSTLWVLDSNKFDLLAQYLLT